jgi:hypothetical protein
MTSCSASASTGFSISSSPDADRGRPHADTRQNRRPRAWLGCGRVRPRYGVDQMVAGGSAAMARTLRDSRHPSRFPGLNAGGAVTDSGGFLQSVQGDVQQDRTEHPALGNSLHGRSKPLSGFEHTRCQPRPDHAAGREITERHHKPVVVDPIERRRQIRVQNPCPLGVLVAGLGAGAGQLLTEGVQGIGGTSEPEMVDVVA